MDDTAHSSNDESIVASGDAANEIKAANIWLLPCFSIVDSVGVWKFLDMESILFSRLLLLLLLEGLHLGVRRSILPVVNDIIGGNYNMSIVHCHMFWLNADILAIDGAANSAAELNHPGVSNQVGLGELRHKNAVVSAGLDIAERLHVLDRFLVNLGVPESDAHVSSFGLSISEYDGVIEERPHVLRLDVGKEDVRIHGQDNSETKSFPGDAVHHA